MVHLESGATYRKIHIHKLIKMWKENDELNSERKKKCTEEKTLDTCFQGMCTSNKNNQRGHAIDVLRTNRWSI